MKKYTYTRQTKYGQTANIFKFYEKGQETKQAAQMADKRNRNLDRV